MSLHVFVGSLVLYHFLSLIPRCILIDVILSFLLFLGAGLAVEIKPILHSVLYIGQALH